MFLLLLWIQTKFFCTACYIINKSLYTGAQATDNQSNSPPASFQNWQQEKAHGKLSIITATKQETWMTCGNKINLYHTNQIIIQNLRAAHSPRIFHKIILSTSSGMSSPWLKYSGYIVSQHTVTHWFNGEMAAHWLDGACGSWLIIMPNSIKISSWIHNEPKYFAARHSHHLPLLFPAFWAERENIIVWLWNKQKNSLIVCR